MKIGDKVFVVNWGKHYSNFDFMQWEDVPTYSGINFHWKYVYVDNLTLKGTINKREPKKLVEKIPIYKDYKYEIIAIKKHPKAGEFVYNEEQRILYKDNDKYTENDIYLLASVEGSPNNRCFVTIECTGVSILTPEQFANEKFNALIESNLGKWDRKASVRKDIPEEIISIIYNKIDDVLFGSAVVKGKVKYHYLEGKYTTDGNPMYLGWVISYDGIGNSDLGKDANIASYETIKKMFNET